MKTIEIEKNENLSEATRQVFLNQLSPLFPFSFNFGYLTATVKGLCFSSYPLDFPFLFHKLNSTRLITMGNEVKQQTLKPSNSAPVVTKNKKLKELDISLSTPTKKTAPLIKPVHKPAQIKNSLSVQLKHKKKKLEDEEEVPMTKPVTLAEKRARQAKRAYQIKTWKVREEREAREARSIQRKKLMSGESKKEPVVEATIAKRGVRFNLKKNKIIQIIESV